MMGLIIFSSLLILILLFIISILSIIFGEYESCLRCCYSSIHGIPGRNCVWCTHDDMILPNGLYPSVEDNTYKTCEYYIRCV